MSHNKQASQSGAVAPTSVTPEYIGQLYVDTDARNVYVATGLTSSDWELVPFGNQACLLKDERIYTTYYGGSTNADEKWWTRMFGRTSYNHIPNHIEVLEFQLLEANSTSNYFVVDGDQRTYFPDGHRFMVYDCTGVPPAASNNTGDEPYVVTSTSLTSGDTRINVASVTNTNADGYIINGMFKFKIARKYIVSGNADGLKVGGINYRLVNIDGFSYTSGYVSSDGSTKTDNLRCGYTGEGVGSDTMVAADFMFEVQPTADSVWEFQQWSSEAESNSKAMGRSYPVFTGNKIFGLLKISPF